MLLPSNSLLHDSTFFTSLILHCVPCEDLLPQRIIQRVCTRTKLIQLQEVVSYFSRVLYYFSRVLQAFSSVSLHAFFEAIDLQKEFSVVQLKRKNLWSKNIKSFLHLLYSILLHLLPLRFQLDSEIAEIESRTVALLHWQSDSLTTRLYLSSTTLYQISWKNIADLHSFCTLFFP